MTVAWNYNGSDTLAVALTGMVPSEWYNFLCEQGTGAIVQADGSGNVAFTFTDVIDPGGIDDDPGSVIHYFGVQVRHVTDNIGSFDIEWVACNVFLYGDASTTGMAFAAVWTYDGDKTIEIDYPSVSGLVYDLRWSEFVGGGETGGSVGPQTGDGSTQTLTAVMASTPDPVAGYVRLEVADPASLYPTETHVACNRMFVGGSIVLLLGNPASTPTPPAPTRRFFRGYPWRFIVTDTSSRTLTFLDRLATNRTVTKAMDQPMDASGNVPSDNPEINILHTDGDPFLNEGNRLVYGFRREGWDGTTPPWVCRFAGPLDHLEDIAGTNSPVTQWTARDPWQYLYRRPLRLEDGSLPGPLGRVFLASDLWTYTEIAYQLLLDTITYDGACHIDAFSGTVAPSPVITENVTFQQGLSIGAAWDQICATNKAHIVLDPVYDPVGSPGMCVIFNCYPEIGTVQNAAVFAWDLPSRSLVGINRQIDGTQRANRIQFYYGQGGPPVLLASDAASIAKYGEYWQQQFWPGFRQAGPVQAMAAQQLRLLRDGLISYSFQPAPERSPIPFDDYTVGDWAPFYASKKLRAALQPSLASGQWVDIPRIRAFTLQIADNQTEAVSELLTAKEPLNA